MHLLSKHLLRADYQILYKDTLDPIAILKELLD